MDPLAQQAREHHRESVKAGNLAARHRQQRDQLVRQLRSTNPGRWTYAALAKAVGCSPELIATIIKDR